MKINKKGQQSWELILIVIGVIMLIVLIYFIGKSAGWWSSSTGQIVPSSASAAETGCKTACTSVNKFDYCCKRRDVIYAELTEPKLEICPTLKNVECQGIIDCKPEYCTGVICEESKIKRIVDCIKKDQDITKYLGADAQPLESTKVCCKV